MGTSYQEIREIIFRPPRQRVGTQVRAAIVLGITPETVLRFLRRCDRARIGSPQVPEAWPAIAINRFIGRTGEQRPVAGSSHLGAPCDREIGRT